MNLTLRKHMSVWQKRLYLYPPPDAMPHTRLFWVATGLVGLMALLFAGYFIFYLTGRHDAFITSAEDLGIMDQAIWSALHGQLLHQSICNVVNDTNCYSAAGISRFAIHFEPILFPVSLLFLLWPGPKTLLVLQTLVVASGAFPAFWLARLRLRNELAAAAIALLYLLYPSQQQATVYDFHAVTFTAALLLFTLYFMYTRRTIWLFVFAILSMACKEEMPLVIICLGLWSMLFQQRWRTGLALVLLAAAWLALGFLVIHFYSPTGQSLLTSRYAQLGDSPLAIAKTLLLHPRNTLRLYVFEYFHRMYLRILFSPVMYLPLLAPWVLVLAVPSLALNLLSSNGNMHSGYFQYNAEIIPVLIFATIEGIVVLLWLVQWCMKRFQVIRQKRVEAELEEPRPAKPQLHVHGMHLVMLVCVIGLLIYSMIRADQAHGAVPFSSVSADAFQGLTQYSPKFQWPQTNAHLNLAQRFINMLPATASVSAQSHLVPHVSERMNMYLFPYADDHADYIFLDVTGNTYPLLPFPYIREVKKVLLSGNYGIVAAQDGYLLLKRGLPPPGVSRYSAYSSSTSPGASISDVLPQLPPEFCSFVRVAPSQVQGPLQVTFNTNDGSAMNMVGMLIYPPRVFSLHHSSMQISTYWRVSAPTASPVRLLGVVTDKNGKDKFATVDFPAISWCPTNTWQPGTVISVMTGVFFLSKIPNGLAHVSLALLPVTHPSSTIMNEESWYSLHVIHAPVPVMSNHGGKALQLAVISIVP
ncbi:MAG: DUF2079 domain-containing protein [Ktedonobacteraceae bacterium]